MSQQWQGPPGQQGYGPPQNGPQPYGQPFGPGMGGPPPKSGSNTLVIVLVIVGGLIVVVGIVAALAISGVRRYLSSAKAAEAKNTISALSRDVVASYEREQMDPLGSEPTASSHRLCGSAIPVPATVPRGTKYLPSSASGKDFDTGDETHGWKCLKYNATYTSYFQYDYRVGSGYKGPARGGPDPGPDGFEISAEGDLNGDGVTSLFTMTGKVDKATHTVHVDPQMFVSNEFE